MKNVVLHSDATALASMVLPVPGGPIIRIPFQGRRIPLYEKKNKKKNQNVMMSTKYRI